MRGDKNFLNLEDSAPSGSPSNLRDVISTMLSSEVKWAWRTNTKIKSGKSRNTTTSHSLRHLKKCWLVFLSQISEGKERLTPWFFLLTDLLLNSTCIHWEATVGQTLACRAGSGGAEAEEVQGCLQKPEKCTSRSPAERNLKANWRPKQASNFTPVIQL